MKQRSADNASHEPFLQSWQMNLEEMASILDDCQSAVFGGKFHELELCLARSQQILLRVNESCRRTGALKEKSAHDDLITRLRHRTQVFAGVLKRKQMCLAVLRNLLAGPSASYGPRPTRKLEQEG